jgi:hypothetical protein
MAFKEFSAYLLIATAAGLVVGIAIGVAMSEDSKIENYKILAEACEEYVEYYHAEEESIRRDQAFTRLRERSRLISRVMKASDLDIPYEVLIVDLGRGYQELVATVEEQLPEDLHYLDQLYWDAALHTGKVLERRTADLERKGADQEWEEK